MNNYLRSEDISAYSAASDTTLYKIGPDDFGPATPSPGWTIVSSQSGLPFTLIGGDPASPVYDRSRYFNLALKRILDVTVTALACLLLLPLFIIVAVIIKISSKGPILFRQEREGLDGAIFRAYKFRSMRVEDSDPTGIRQVSKNDPRITKIGAIIRKTSIDELPQLINVLRGEMSLVGPRPHVPFMLAGVVPYEDLVPYYRDRLKMLPGLSGWAQANGFRGSTADAELAKCRIDHDIAYIQNFSIWLDIKIIAKTALNEFITGSGH